MGFVHEWLLLQCESLHQMFRHTGSGGGGRIDLQDTNNSNVLSASFGFQIITFVFQLDQFLGQMFHSCLKGNNVISEGRQGLLHFCYGAMLPDSSVFRRISSDFIEERLSPKAA